MNKSSFTGDETIVDILLAVPESYEVLASYGLHCMGCPVAPEESLENGAASHGIRGRAFEQLLEDLNEMKTEKEANL
jgi:hybrid cluster-associated redox disulfide protein